MMERDVGISNVENERIAGRRVCAWGLLLLAATGINAFVAPLAAQQLGLRMYVLYPVLGFLGLVCFVGGAFQWATGRGGFGAEHRTPLHMATWFALTTVALFLCSLLVGALSSP